MYCLDNSTGVDGFQFNKSLAAYQKAVCASWDIPLPGGPETFCPSVQVRPVPAARQCAVVPWLSRRAWVQGARMKGRPHKANGLEPLNQAWPPPSTPLFTLLTPAAGLQCLQGISLRPHRADVRQRHAGDLEFLP